MHGDGFKLACDILGEPRATELLEWAKWYHRPYTETAEPMPVEMPQSQKEYAITRLLHLALEERAWFEKYISEQDKEAEELAKQREHGRKGAAVTNAQRSAKKEERIAEFRRLYNHALAYDLGSSAAVEWASRKLGVSPTTGFNYLRDMRRE